MSKAVLRSGVRMAQEPTEADYALSVSFMTYAEIKAVLNKYGFPRVDSEEQARRVAPWTFWKLQVPLSELRKEPANAQAFAAAPPALPIAPATVRANTTLHGDAVQTDRSLLSRLIASRKDH